MKSQPKRGADRLVRRMVKGVRPARMEVDCSGGELSCNGGAAPLMMLAEQVQLFERASACFTDHRDPSKVVHPLVALLGQRILGLALGYEDVNDYDELRRDRALSTAMGRVECARSDCEPLAGKSTLNRMELSANGRDPAKARRITADFDALDELLVELYLVWGERGQIAEAAGAGYRCHGRGTARPAGAPVLSRVLPCILLPSAAGVLQRLAGADGAAHVERRCGGGRGGAARAARGPVAEAISAGANPDPRRRGLLPRRVDDVVRGAGRG